MLAKELEKCITDYIENYSKTTRVMTEWKTPLVAFAKADDPLFRELKKVISPDHMLPEELLPDARSVIAYFIPFETDVNTGNKGGNTASPEWAQAYVETNKLITDLNTYLIKRLGEKGHRAQLIPPTHNFDKERLISNWSHKHIGYIAGLGTFGVHHMLITKKGINGRLGSIVTSLQLEPTERPGKEYCLYKARGTCLKCLEKCPAGALRKAVYDRRKCYDLCLKNAEIYRDKGLADVCGKCGSGVPCAFINPADIT